MLFEARNIVVVPPCVVMRLERPGSWEERGVPGAHCRRRSKAPFALSTTRRWPLPAPAWDPIDVSLGYNTGDQPANDYLKRITIQLSVQNITGKHAAFEYDPSTSARNISAYDRLKPNTGRTIGITLLKAW